MGTKFEIDLVCLDPRVDIDDGINDMLPFTRRNFDATEKDQGAFERFVRRYEAKVGIEMTINGTPAPQPNQYAPELCEMIVSAFPKWKCKAGNLIDFEVWQKTPIMKRYVWIQIPKCYERYSKLPYQGFLLDSNKIQCEILVYQPTDGKKKKAGKN